MKTTDSPIIVEQTFKSSVKSVWKALTELAQMHRWYFDNIPSFKPEVGFETRFNIKSNDRNFLHIWKVTEVQPLKSIKYTWEFKGYKGKSSSLFEISKQNDLTKLKLTVDVLEDFQDGIPEFSSDSCIAGWKYFINDRLNEYLKNI